MARPRLRPTWAILGMALGTSLRTGRLQAQPARPQARQPAAAAVDADPPAVQATASVSVPSGALQEVVVTAERVAQNIQRVPASMNVLTSSSLSHLQITTPQDLMTYIPQLQANGIAGEATPMYSIRGVSMMDYSVGQQGPVEEYLDQVPLETRALSGGVNLFDMQRIDVLLGPQGTLYGHNATAGAINFVTQPPKFHDSGYITLGAGNYRFREGNAARLCNDWVYFALFRYPGLPPFRRLALNRVTFHVGRGAAQSVRLLRTGCLPTARLPTKDTCSTGSLPNRWPERAVPFVTSLVRPRNTSARFHFANRTPISHARSGGRRACRIWASGHSRNFCPTTAFSLCMRPTGSKSNGNASSWA